MARHAGRAVVRWTATIFLSASAVVVAGVLPAAATTRAMTCPHGSAAVTDVAYVVFHLDGSSDNVSTLQGNVRLGDTVNALFNVPALPSGCSQVQLSLTSYSSSRRPASRNLSLFSFDTGEFLSGGRYEMSVTVAPPSHRAPRVRFKIAFATGPALMLPRYGQDLIDSAKN